MSFSAINWLAVLVCVVVSMVSGAIWYHPKVFFMTWWRGIGKGEDEQPGGNMAIIWPLTILASLVQAIFMALFVHALGSLSGGATLISGATTGLLLWLGFIAPTYLVNKLFAGHGFPIWGIEAGNHLVNFILFGAILGAWH